MSVLIKGMEMPKVPGVYSLDLYVEEICQVQNLDGAAFEAIEIPPHGRLIDADALEYHADNVKDPMGRTEKTVMWKKIEAAPTIIPASEDGET